MTVIGLSQQGQGLGGFGLNIHPRDPTLHTHTTNPDLDALRNGTNGTPTPSQISRERERYESGLVHRLAQGQELERGSGSLPLRIRTPNQTRFQRHVLNRFGVGVGTGGGAREDRDDSTGRGNFTVNGRDQEQGSEGGQGSDVGVVKGGLTTGAGGPYYGNYSEPGPGPAQGPGLASGQGNSYRPRHRSSSSMGIYDDNHGDGDDVHDNTYSNVMDDSWSLHSHSHRNSHRDSPVTDFGNTGGNSNHHSNNHNQFSNHQYSNSDAISHHHRVNFELNRTDSFKPAAASHDQPSDVYTCFYDPHTQQYYPTFQHNTSQHSNSNVTLNPALLPHNLPPLHHSDMNVNGSDHDSTNPDPTRFFRALTGGNTGMGKGKSQGSQEGQGQGQGEVERPQLQSPLKLLHATDSHRSSNFRGGGGVDITGARYRQSPTRNAALELLRNGNNSKVHSFSSLEFYRYDTNYYLVTRTRTFPSIYANISYFSL